MDLLSGIAPVIGATLHGADVAFERVVTDTRDMRGGDLFLAIKGEHFDAHDFVGEARRHGAAAAIVSRRIDDPLPQLLVGDTLHALASFGAHWRGRFQLPVVAVTGSNGKTTTKQMLASIFEARGPVLATLGNLNNHIGLPLTLLGLRPEHRTAVIEMGANHLGEIGMLTGLTRPDVGVVTQAGDAHLEGFGSREGVARGKGELFQGLSGGIAAINMDDAYAPLWRTLAQGASIIGFGFGESADVRAVNFQPHPVRAPTGSEFELLTPSGRQAVRLPLPGRHNVHNALAAAACAIALGVDLPDIAAGFARMEPAQGRLSWRTTPEGARLLDDTYNANPTSLRAGLELLASLPGERWAIVGAMAELGPDAARLHYEAGQLARELGIDRLLALGPLAAESARAFGAAGAAYDSVEELTAEARRGLRGGIAVLVKGSRSSRMERVVSALTGTAAGESH
ncbi:MAG TPA: UDP-N-acetylmuramoyl-tripeptide--D-alanyl-D-alanine ligase [Candidatus Binatia bacterium]|nr:UDP-N-acetylmuramoyl-tripeptide--D-alanyl-D-alanine ligase [Candidatus Binatia bacterium]